MRNHEENHRKDTNTQRTIELAEKLWLKENAWLIQYTPKWVVDSESWAKKMLDNAQSSLSMEGLRHLYVMNHLCPSLYQFHKEPDPRGITPEQYNYEMGLHMRENSQATFTDRSGKVIQDGVYHDEENWNALLTVLDTIYEEYMPKIQRR